MIAAPRFYAEGLGEPYLDCANALKLVAPGPIGRLAAGRPRLRAAVLALGARRGRLGLVAIRGEPGTLTALAVCAVAPSRRAVYVCELLCRPPSRSRSRRFVRGVWARLVEGPLLRRGAAGAQAMTAWERDELTAAHRLDPERVALVPWPLREGGDKPAAAIEPDSRRVFASGRTACDWETLFAAASGAAWELIVVCSKADAGRVHGLAEALVGSRVDVRVEVPWAEHDQLLRASAVCAIVIADRGLSAGQVRLMSAVEAGVPVVATAVRALSEHIVAGETALMVEPSDPVALRGAIDDLLADSSLRRELRDRARERAADSTYSHYFAQLREVIGEPLHAVR